ncbi:hypothetical protein ACFOLH_02515 [Aquipuribacter hungaricus]|uniref:Fibronectin type-III domain-containing protein n=2 Tax=Aquipuribacter hungaricus TaxID=545624 RepID=A0ABV7WF79_9MICO
MPTTVLATALPRSLDDEAAAHLTVFLTHKLVDGTVLSDFPAAVDWPTTLAGCTFSLTTSLDPAGSIPLRVVSVADAASWAAVLPPTMPVAGFPAPTLSQETWRTLPASRMSDHAVDLHLAAVTAAPARRPGLEGDPVAGALLHTMASLDRQGALGRLLEEAPVRARRDQERLARRLQDAVTTLGPLTADDDEEKGPRDGRELPPLPPYQRQVEDRPSPVQLLLEDPGADTRTSERLDRLAGEGRFDDPGLQLVVDAHAVRRYYERPEQPQEPPRRLPDPDAVPTPRPERPEQDFHARVAGFGSTPSLLRRLGLAVDVVLETDDGGAGGGAAARAALAGATWVSVTMTSPAEDLQVLPPRRTAVVVDGDLFAARSSEAWVSGLLPLGDEDWVVLDADPDAAGLKLEQHARTLARHYASEANGDPATSAPATLRSTGFALARRERSTEVLARVQRAEALAADDGTRELLLDDLVRGIRVEVWDDATRRWHSLHRRRVTVTGGPGDVPVLTDEPDVGFLQLSALNRASSGSVVGYYLHEVVAGWDGWSLSAPRPGLTVVHVEPPGPDGETEAVVETVPDAPGDGARTTSRVEPGSLPRLRHGTSYSFRVLAVDLAGGSVPAARAGRPGPPDPAPGGGLPGRRPPGRRPGRGPVDRQALEAARAHLDRLRDQAGRRDLAGIAATRRVDVVEHLRAARAAGRAGTGPGAQGDIRGGLAPGSAAGLPGGLPDGLRSGDDRLDAVLAGLLAAAARERPDRSSAQRALDDLAVASLVLAERHEVLRVRPQLRTDPELLAEVGRHEDLRLPGAARRLDRASVTAPRPYLRWEPVPAPAVVPRHQLGTGEQPAHLVVRTGIPAGEGPDTRAAAERHVVPPKSTQAEAETAGLFDAAIGTGDAAETRRLYAVALAERGTLLDEQVPSLTDARATDAQPGIALVDRPGADTGSADRATLADITARRGRQIGEGQYVVHDTDALRLPYLPDPYATGVSLVFFESGAPHALPEPRALQAVTVPYPGRWPSLQPLRLVVEPGATLSATVEGHEVRVTLPPGEQVRVAVSSTVDVASLEKFGLWRSQLASVADPADGFTQDEVVASAALMRAASQGWTWWLTPSVDVRLVHAVPAPVRPPQLRALSVLARPPGRAVVALSGLVDVHGASTDTLLVTATWTEKVDDPAAPAPGEVTRSDVVVRSTVGERQRTGALFLVDLQPTGPVARALGDVGLHRALQTFEDTHHRQVTYVPAGTTRYAEYFDASQLPGAPPAGEPVTLDIPSSARPAAPLVLDAVPLLRWEAEPDPEGPFAHRSVRRSGIRVWLDRPWYSSGDGELLGVLVFDTHAWVDEDGRKVWREKPLQAPDGATSLWAADPVHDSRSGTTDTPTVPPLLSPEELLLDLVDGAAAGPLEIRPPLHGAVVGGRARGWPGTPGHPVDAAEALPLRDVPGRPSARVLGYEPEFDTESRRWFVDVGLQETRALWPFVRLAVARWQPSSIAGHELSAVALTGWVQPLPTRTLTVTRTAHEQVQVTLSGVVAWLRWDERATGDLPGEQLGADTPTGDAAVRAARLQRSRTVRATVQTRPAGAGDLDWQTYRSTVLHATSVEEGGGFRATWSGSVGLPAGSGTEAGEATGLPGFRRPGPDSPDGSTWRVLVEEHELLDADPVPPAMLERQVPRLVYAGSVPL